MPSYYRYLYNSIFTNLILYYLIITLAPVINPLIVLTILISLFRYLLTKIYKYYDTKKLIYYDTSTLIRKNKTNIINLYKEYGFQKSPDREYIWRN